MESVDVEEALKVFNFSLSQIKWRLKPSSKRRLETDILALWSGMRPLVMVDYGGKMPELQEQLCSLLKLINKDCTIFQQLRVMVIEDMIYLLNAKEFSEYVSWSLNSANKQYFVDLEQDPPKMVSTDLGSSNINELVSVQRYFSLVFTPDGINRDALQRPIEDHQQDDKSSSKVCQLSEVLDFSSCMQDYQITIPTLNGMLYDELKRLHKLAHVGWLCPFTIRGERCMKEKKSVKEYILNSFKKSVEQRHKMIIAPYLQGEHWLLIVVCPWNDSAYVFDSVTQEETPRMLLVKGIMNSVWRELTEKREQRSSSNLFWVNLQCAQQDDGESCGYYIMSYMNDLVLCAKGKVKLTEVLRHKNSEALTKAQIDEVRDKFAIYILDNLMMF